MAAVSLFMIRKCLCISEFMRRPRGQNSLELPYIAQLDSVTTTLEPPEKKTLRMKHQLIGYVNNTVEKKMSANVNS